MWGYVNIKDGLSLRIIVADIRWPGGGFLTKNDFFSPFLGEVQLFGFLRYLDFVNGYVWRVGLPRRHFFEIWLIVRMSEKM